MGPLARKVAPEPGKGQAEQLLAVNEFEDPRKPSWSWHRQRKPATIVLVTLLLLASQFVELWLLFAYALRGALNGNRCVRAASMTCALQWRMRAHFEAVAGAR